MATIVEYKKTGMQFILLGAGYGEYQSAVWGLPLMKERESGTSPLVCVCDAVGRIGWFPTDEVVVVSIDGKKVEDVFP